jgi:hypothetical protein
MSTVDHPKHYNTGQIEVIDAIEDWKLSFHLGNVVKYVARAMHKGNALEDLQKAMWYLQRQIDILSGGASPKEEAKEEAPWEPLQPFSLFHRLWTKAVGTPYYVKPQWRKFENWLLQNIPDFRTADWD